MHLEFLDDDRPRPCTLSPDGETWTVHLDEGGPWTVLPAGGGAVDLIEDGRRRRAWVVRRDGERLVFLDGRVHVFRQPGDDDEAHDEAAGGGPRVVADMPGKVVKVGVAEGDAVEPGTPLLILEAMKMEAVQSAAVAGRVLKVHVAEGDQVGQGDLLVEIQEEAAE